jgi:hypothetical protein
MWDFLSFRIMISAGLIKIIYPIGALAILGLPLVAFGIIPKAGSAINFSELPWAALMLGVIIEQLILLFSIHQSLKKTADGSIRQK